MPEAWLILSDFFNQMFFDNYADVATGFKAYFLALSCEQQSEVHLFLDNVMSRNLSSSEMIDIWKAAEPDVMFIEENAEYYFEQFLELSKNQSNCKPENM